MHAAKLYRTFRVYSLSNTTSNTANFMVIYHNVCKIYKKNVSQKSAGNAWRLQAEISSAQDTRNMRKLTLKMWQ